MSKGKESNPRSSKSPTSKVSTPEDGVGKRIQQKRTEYGWSQSVLATRTKLADVNGEGISRTVISGYETGEYKPGAREIRVLCETLKVSPNWLLYDREAPFEALQPSMEMTTLRPNEHEAGVPMRMAFAISMLEPHERDALYSLVLSMAGRKLGDRKLSSLLYSASLISDAVLKKLKEDYADIFEGRSLSDALEKVALEMSEAMLTNWGNRLNLEEDDGEQGLVLKGGKELYPTKSN
ncbi:helix-turn-helix domain-containing protein [Trinickia acidisoli]|uniref:helix-turn-helix domain-containing protein n=1 Tax=Trinickia acidisoli TaxID=2767482 RepID=UPI001A8EAD9E|nr:helix-turn-helix transcriptional regulator [Trinickia acidisoli]